MAAAGFLVKAVAEVAPAWGVEPTCQPGTASERVAAQAEWAVVVAVAVVAAPGAALRSLC